MESFEQCFENAYEVYLSVYTTLLGKKNPSSVHWIVSKKLPKRVLTGTVSDREKDNGRTPLGLSFYLK